MGKVKESQNLSAEMSSMDDCITHLREQEAKLKEEVKFLKGKEKERLCLQMWLDDLKQQGYCSFEKKTSLGSAWEKSMTIHFVHDTKGKQKDIYMDIMNIHQKKLIYQILFEYY